MINSTDDPDSRSGVTMARLPAPTPARRTRIALFADPHVATRASGGPNVSEATERRLIEAIRDVNTREVDAVVSTGDLTNDGEPWNGKRVDDILNDLDVPFHAVPGNHDVPKAADDHDSLSLSAFAGRYAPDEPPFVVEVGGIDLIGLNSATTPEGELRDTHEGCVSNEQRDWLAQTLPDLEEPVVMVHHNLSPVCSQIRAEIDDTVDGMRMPPLMRDPDPLTELLAEHGVPLTLSGHIHMPMVGREGPLWEIAAPSTCSFPQAYLVIEFGPEGTTVTFVPLGDRTASDEAFELGMAYAPLSARLTGMAAARLASFPLAEER